MRFARALLLLGLFAWALGTPALASDGALEINQTCAVSTGCFPGDTAGLPVTISAGGSYRLTSNLTLPDLNTSGILDSALAPVTVDLGGFAIEGPNTCTVNSCGTGSGVGVGYTNPGGDGLTVINGAVRGAGGSCLRLRSFGRAEGVFVSNCGGHGIFASDNGVVVGNRVTNLRLNALLAGSNTVFADNVFANAGLGGVVGNTFAVEGGKATGGNACDDRSCSARGARRFYMTPARFNGAQASSACVAGFHLAAATELVQLASLEYDTTRGYTLPESGRGYTINVQGGWNGWVLPGFGGGGGHCNLYSSSATNETGSAGGYGPSGEFGYGSASCNQTLYVWCIED